MKIHFLAAEQRAIVAHSASYGSGHPQISQAPAGAAENHFELCPNLSPHPELGKFLDIVPTVITVGYYRSLLRSFISKRINIKNSKLDLWRTPSPIC